VVVLIVNHGDNSPLCVDSTLELIAQMRDQILGIVNIVLDMGQAIQAAG
jgi:hypothetical protein